MKKIFLILLLAIISCFCSAAYCFSNSNEKEKLEKLKGTFRINTQLRTYELPSNLSDIIERNRLKDKDTSLILGTGVELLIYATSKIPTHMQQD